MNQSFSYRAQTRMGEALSGTIDAVSADDAQRKLQLLQLHVLQLAPAEKPRGGRTLSAEDLIAFNQQLVHLTTAGLPLERGLRLIAEEMRTGRLAGAIRELAADLESGVPIEKALENRTGVFPTSYARVLEAGAKSGSLPGVLLNLSRHLNLMRRLRSTLWRTLAYPLVVFVALSGVLLFLSAYVLPAFEMIFKEFKISLPELTRLVISAGHWLPPLIIALFAAAILGGPVMYIIRRMNLDGGLCDLLIMKIPLIGSIVKRSVVAGWCDTVRVGVEASMDLPAAISLASTISPSRQLERDGESLVGVLASGRTLEQSMGLRVLPATVPVAVAHGAAMGDLPGTLRSLTDLYEQQADVRVNALPGILTPLLLCLMAATIGLAIVSLMLPLVALIRASSGI